jgi:hypothetical protein
MQIAMVARQGEVGGVGRSAVLTWNNVLNVETKKRIGILVNPAVFASFGGAPPNETTKCGIHAM